MPDAALPAASAELAAFIGRHTDKVFDWDAFPGSRGFPELARAQMRYIGAGGSNRTDDPSTLKPEHFTLSLVHQAPGTFAASHAHEVVESFLVLGGVLTVGWAWDDTVIEARLGPKDLCLHAVDRPHGFRNDGVEPVLMSISVGSGKPKPPRYLAHPKDVAASKARAFGAAPGKTMALDPASRDPRHQEFARHVVRYRDRVPAWQPAGFAAMPYVGPGGAPAEGYRMDLIHLPRGQGVRAYARDVEDAFLVLEGVVTIGWETAGGTAEARLGPRDAVLNPAGRPHWFRNDGVADAQLMMLTGSPEPETVAFQAA